jgi:hypothetical protein
MTKTTTSPQGGAQRPRTRQRTMTLVKNGKKGPMDQRINPKDRPNLKTTRAKNPNLDGRLVDIRQPRTSIWTEIFGERKSH